MNYKKDILIFITSLAVIVALVAIGFKTSPPAKAPMSDEEGVPASVSWPSQKVEDVVVKEKTENYDINAVYPKTASDSITLYFKNYVENQISQFKDDTSWVNDIESASSQSLTLDINYKFVEGSTAQNYIFSVNTYTGGAHGLQVRKSFNFNKEGQLLTISNIFSNGFDGLNTFASLVQKELLKRDGVNPQWVSDGASAIEENYKTFIITDAGVTVLFDPYQVAAYAEGPIDISIPVSAFSKIANKDIFPNQ